MAPAGNLIRYLLSLLRAVVRKISSSILRREPKAPQTQEIAPNAGTVTATVPAETIHGPDGKILFEQPTSSSLPSTERSTRIPPPGKRSPTRPTPESPKHETVPVETDVSDIPDVIDLNASRHKTSRPPKTSDAVKDQVDSPKQRSPRKARVRPPWIELALQSNEKIQLVIPKAEIKTGVVGPAPDQLTYDVTVNKEQRSFQIRPTPSYDGYVQDEYRLALNEPLAEFEVKFPEHLRNCCYRFAHPDWKLYAFVAGTRDGSGRLLYRCDKLPRRLLWILLHEDFSLEPDAPLKDEPDQWVWDKYRPFLLDLTSASNLALKNRSKAETIQIACEPYFQIEGEGLTEDDYMGRSPLFSGMRLKLLSPDGTSTSLDVWLQDASGGVQLIKEDWDGQGPLEFFPLSELSRKSGEFQIDLCDNPGNQIAATVFFRCLPGLKLEFPKDLILPDPQLGHQPALVTIGTDNPQFWEFCDEEGKIISRREEGTYSFLLDALNDCCSLSVAPKDSEMSRVHLRVTLPRLRWRLGNGTPWVDHVQPLERSNFVTGRPLEFQVCIGADRERYTMSVILQEGDHILQGPVFLARQQKIYQTEVNQFYDTIRDVDAPLEIRLRVQSSKNEELLRIIPVMRITAEPRETPTPSKPTKLLLSEIEQFPPAPIKADNDAGSAPIPDPVSTIPPTTLCRLLRTLRDLVPQQRWASKKILRLYYRTLSGRHRIMSYRDRLQFTLRSLALLKTILEAKPNLGISNLKKWHARIQRIEHKYPAEFRAALKRCTKRR